MSVTKLPGLIDPHVHLRDPGAPQKEDFETGSKAAVAGGFVCVLDMPNNPQPTITRAALNDKLQRITEKSVCDIGCIFGASQHDNTAEFHTVIDDVYALKIYMDTTTGDLLLEEQDMLERTFSAWPSHKPIIVHAEDETMNNAIALAQKFDKTLHIAHLSQKKELERVMQEKERGMNISCEVTPHHLFLTEQDREHLGPYGIMKPPLRTREDVDFLWNHIDAIDCIATDHAPHTTEEKESGNPPYGVPGLETSLPLMLTAVHEGRIALDDVIRMMHTRPKEIFNIAIADDSYCEVSLDTTYDIRNTDMHTKCGWTPFDGMTVTGKVIKTVISGTDVFTAT